MSSANAIKVHRKSGVAKWRDLLFLSATIRSQWKRHPPLCHPACPGLPWKRSRPVPARRGGICSFTQPRTNVLAIQAVFKSIFVGINSMVFAGSRRLMRGWAPLGLRPVLM
jgi:hypothetical protein